ncbi:hypothetical protein H257_01276 [Aphanomyces astaci]|uniref:Uncharacterized protein n=1 Tax=Aphanomyces astaci TaxID=112090 RepID=W4H7G8_APHAT|nr:hypothetical protein H257_01276 [Aphanomyces astaci]ETV87837.1 hypothetical protein H257_01276 [Aphanomyces astaci]|eukprot:XP_009822700.1 hypothetical protein H257_01276 [Aphanomyces astaci]
MCFLDSSIIQRIDACRRAMDQANPRALAIPVVYYPVLYERRYKLHFTIEATVLPSRVNVATLMPATSACFGSVSYICKVSYIRYGNQQANPGTRQTRHHIAPPHPSTRGSIRLERTSMPIETRRVAGCGRVCSLQRLVLH